MRALLQKTLKVVPAPLIEVVPKAPPALEMPNQSPTVEFTVRQLRCRPDPWGRR